MTFVSAEPGQGTYNSESGGWNVGTVYPGTPVTLVIKAKVIDPAAQEVTAAISTAEQPDSNADNNAASASVTPVLASLKLSTAVSSKQLLVGGAAVFTLTVKNSGPGMARDVVVAETLGPGLKFLRFEPPSRGVFNPTTKTWTIKKLPANTTATLRVLAIVSKTGRLESTATLTATGIDLEKSQVEAAAAVTGTKLNTPATWSYAGLGSFTRPVPVPARVTIPVTSMPTPTQFLQAMNLASANLQALQAMMWRWGMY
jgi:uncharacterized repeat protein (TIGR01451 family)